MRVVFFGTPPFAARVLKFLIENGVEIAAVISRPDRPVGRSRQVIPVAVKVEAEKQGIAVFQPEKVSDPAFADTLRSFNADLFVVVAYGEILKQHVLDTPKKGCINLHASLLPKYRGAAPIQQALIRGEKETGVTIIHMVKKMDAGAMIAKVSLEVPLDMTYGELDQKLSEAGSRLLLDVIRRAEIELPKGEEQIEEEATFAPKIELEDCKLDWNKSALELHHLVRGVNPEPGAFSDMQIAGEKKRLKIFKTFPGHDSSLPIGHVKVAPDKKVLAGCGVGSLELIEVQPEGKKRMRAFDFIQGVPGKAITLI